MSGGGKCLCSLYRLARCLVEPTYTFALTVHVILYTASHALPVAVGFAALLAGGVTGLDLSSNVSPK